MTGSDVTIGWDKLVVTPDGEAVAELRRAWAWLLPEEFKPVLFSALGDMFFETAAGDVRWLNTGTGEVSTVADDLDAFRAGLGTERADEFFLPPLIADLIAAGKPLGPGQCYAYVTLPVFAEGGYTVDNLVPISMKEHFGFTGSVHEQLRDLPEGARVRFKVTD